MKITLRIVCEKRKLVTMIKKLSEIKSMKSRRDRLSCSFKASKTDKMFEPAVCPKTVPKDKKTPANEAIPIINISHFGTSRAGFSIASIRHKNKIIISKIDQPGNRFMCGDITSDREIITQNTGARVSFLSK